MPHLSIPELAKAVGLSRNAVWLHVRRGLLRADRIAGLRSRWHVSREEATNYAKQLGVDLVDHEPDVPSVKRSRTIRR